MQFPAKKLRVASGLPYLLIELWYIGIPVVRTGARTVTWLPKFLGCIDNQILLPVAHCTRGRSAVGPLQQAIHVVQNRRAGDQSRTGARQTKKSTI